VRIGVMGAGAVGSLVGATLSRRHDVVLVGRKPHVEAIQKRGLRVGGLTRKVAYVEAYTSARALADCDIVLLTVKAYDTLLAARSVAHAAPNAVLVSLQNGLDNAGKLRRAARGMDTCLAITSMGVTFLGPGRIRHAGRGSTQLGPLTASRKDAARVARALRSGGLQVELVGEIKGHVWLKGIVNHCINPLTVINRCRNGRLLKVARLRREMAELCEEAVAVARAKRVRLPPGDPLARVEEVARLTSRNRSSMLQDVQRGRRTEVGSITGHIVRLGESYGLDLPRSRDVLREVRRIEREARGRRRR
jgi:2-dehydropantoate 2-reductase